MSSTSTSKYNDQPAEGLPPPPEGFKVLTEGKASVLHENKEEVFYNPAMVTNRDLSILMIRVYISKLAEEVAGGKKKKRVPKEDLKQDGDGDGLRILEALSATGLRSIRFAKEIPEGISTVVVNDFDERAVQAITRNIEYNNITSPRLEPSHGDATAVMYENRGHRFDVVDIDPYGSPAVFLDSAVQSVKDGGMLCVTATDMAVLCGNHPEVCFAKYGANSVKGKHCHEVALRILLSSIERTAIRYRRYIEPLLSLSIDYYVRIFVRVRTSPDKVKESLTKNMLIHQCNNCSTFYPQRLGKMDVRGNSKKYGSPTVNAPVLCEQCDSRLIIGGPLWGGPLHAPEWVSAARSLLESELANFGSGERLLGLITSAEEEVDSPLFLDLPHLSNVLHVNTPQIRSVYHVLEKEGFKVSNSHCNPNAIKTDAPSSYVWDIMRNWAKQHPPVPPKAASPAAKILAKEPAFEVELIQDKKSKGSKGRFLPNPTDNWGPKARAGTKRALSTSEDGANKRHKEMDVDEA